MCVRTYGQTDEAGAKISILTLAPTKKASYGSETLLLINRRIENENHSISLSVHILVGTFYSSEFKLFLLFFLELTMNQYKWRIGDAPLKCIE